MDKEKVIKGLVHCYFSGSGTCYEKECPYYRSHNCKDELKNDILSLLKEQEEIELMDFGDEDENEIMANLEGLTWDDWRMYHSDSEVQNIAKSAFDLLITLLKEHEPIEPTSYMDGLIQRFACGNCGKHLLYARWGRDNYCSKCGREVKWECVN